MSIEEAKKTYSEAVTKLKAAENDCQNLVKKLDDMESETAFLNAKVATCEEEEKNVYDSYFLGKASDKDLTDIRKKLQTAKDTLSTHSKMIESLNRCIASKDTEINTLRKQVNSLRHQFWNSLFEQRAAEIPESVRSTVKELITVGLQCSMGMNFILPKIFPLPTNTEIQGIYKRLSEELNIE